MHRVSCFSVHVCKTVFLCRYRTRWRTARLRSRPSTLSYWRTCKTPSARWKNRLPPLSTLCGLHLSSPPPQNHIPPPRIPENNRAPLCSSLWVNVCLCACAFSCGGKRERCTVFIIICCLISAYWLLCKITDCACVCGCNVRMKEGSPRLPSSVLHDLCIHVALPEEDLSVDVL